MKRFFKTICIACIGLLLFASCEELTLSETRFECPAGENTFFFKISTSKSWTAEVSDSSWIKISQEAGNGDAIVTVNLSENQNFYTDRHGSVKIRTSSNLEQFYIVDIIQAGPQTPVFSENDTIYLSAEAQAKVLTVSSEIQVYLYFEGNTIGYDWIKISRSATTSEGYEFTITVKENEIHTGYGWRANLLPRKAYFELKSGTKYYGFWVRQNYKQFNESGDLGLSVEWATCDVGANNSSEAGSNYSESELQELQKDGWRIPTYQEWKELYENSRVLDYDDCLGNNSSGRVFVARNENCIKFDKYGTWWAWRDLSPKQPEKQEQPVKSEPGVVPKLDYSSQYPRMYGDSGSEYFFLTVGPYMPDTYFNNSEPSRVRLVRDKK